MLLDCPDSLFVDDLSRIVPPWSWRWREGHRIHVIHNGDNRGFVWGNNRGLAVYSGEYICLLNSDTNVRIEVMVSIIDSTDIVVVSSAGGVLLDVLALRPWLTDRHVRWVAELAPDTHAELTGERVTWVNEDRGAAAVVLEFFRARRKLRHWRPQVLVSAGTAVAVPWFIAARLVGIPSVWVETWNLVGCHQGIAARICARMAGAVIVQRPERLALHRRAVLAGELY